MYLKKFFLAFVLSVMILSAAGVSAVSASDTVPPPLKVRTTASLRFDRDWTWNISKSADQSSLVLLPGQVMPVNYLVAVDGLPVDSNWRVPGTTTFYNYTEQPLTLTSISTVLMPDGIAPQLTCSAALPAVVPAGGTVVCTFLQAVSDGSSRTTVATAVLEDGRVFSYTADVTVMPPLTEDDECVNVDDSIFGFLGVVCRGSATFPYTVDVGPYEACGSYDVNNIASFVTNDSGASGSAVWNVPVTVPCAGGCSLTPGYWKTHSTYGPASYDETWALVGEDTLFFLSGQSWYNVLWTSPKGNAYYILSHAYIAARLNQLNGADPSVIDAELANAETLFNTYAPDANLPKAVRQEFVRVAAVLDDYNNGLIGPGHCTD
ncbi:MAG: hypothetical protein ACOYYS_09635 [Chloroflexota bacterium]